MVNTGAIMFVCAGTPVHEDEEIVLDTCPGCGKKNQFAFQTDRGVYRCEACKVDMKKEQMICFKCKRPARRPHFKKVMRRRGD